MQLTRTSAHQILSDRILLVASILCIVVLTACDSSSEPTATPSANALPTLTGGAAVFARNCNVCHPGGGRGAGPSLIALGPSMSDDQIKAIVRDGKERMPAYPPEVISDEQLTELVAYIRTMK